MERYNKLIKGGEAAVMLPSDLKLKDGQMYRPCRLFSPQSNCTVKKLEKDGKRSAMGDKQRLNKGPPKEIVFSDSSSDEDGKETSKKRKRSP